MRRIIGIDLGTTNSSVSYYANDEIKIIPNDRGNHLTPSVVSIDENGEVLVGESACNQSMLKNSITIHNVKRYMGSDHLFDIFGRGYSPQEISSFILKNLKNDCETFLGESITQAVITVPAYFSERQRKDTIEAARLSGLKILKILNEPTASALFFAKRKKENRTLLVYDLGGGTFDVSLLKKKDNHFIVVASNGISSLGGIDFDELLYNKITSIFLEKENIEINNDPILSLHLRERIEQAKIELSTRESCEISIPFISSGSQIKHLTYKITRNEFNNIIDPLVEQTMALVEKTLKDSNLSRKDIDNLVLSGGSSRIPLIKNILNIRFGFSMEKQVNPDESVTSGAAFQGYLLSKGNNSIEIQDVTSHSLGVELDDGSFFPIIRKNSPLPAIIFKTFTTVANNQNSVEIKILQGESSRAAKNSLYGRFLLSGIKSGIKGSPRIKVAFKVDNDGLLHVKAKDEHTGVKQNIIFTSSVLDSGSKTLEEEQMILEKRVFSLVNRIKGLNNVTPLSYDFNFQIEIREALIQAKNVLRNPSLDDLWEIKIGLESIVAELNAILDTEGKAV